MILGQGQECSKDRFSQTKRALNVPGMAEPRGAGGQILSADLLTHLNQGGRLGPLHYYSAYSPFRFSDLPPSLCTQSQGYIYEIQYFEIGWKKDEETIENSCAFFYILMDYRIISYHPKVVEGTNFIVVH